MPHPREAIHDVLRTKQEKAKELRRHRGRVWDLKEELKQWTEENLRARANRGK